MPFLLGLCLLVFYLSDFDPTCYLPIENIFVAMLVTIQPSGSTDYSTK